MSSDNKTQYYIVNAFLRTVLIFISFFFFFRGEKTTAFPQILLRERAAPSRDSFLRIGFFDTRREAAFPPKRNGARGMIAPRLRRSLMFRARRAGAERRRMTYPRFRYAFPARGRSAGKGQPQGVVPAGALISRS